MADEIRTAIQENATGPKSARGDSGEVTQHDLDKQILADQYLANKTGQARPHRGVRFTRLVPPGAE